MNKKITSDIVLKYLARFPNTPALTLAKKIYAENKESFTSIDHARSIIRNYTGKSGKKIRDSLTNRTFIKTEPAPYNPFNLPQSHAEDYTPVIISQSKTLIISDLHFPYQCNEAITAALQYGLDNGANCILINGDLIDFHGQSRFEKNPKARSTKQEFDDVRSFLETLRRLFPKARIIYKLGNHDERWEKWLYVKAPEIFDMNEFQLETILRLGELKIEVVKEKLPINIGKLTVLHGHELQGGGGVNPARATFMKTISNVLIGHCHRSSQHTEPTLLGDIIVTTSTGALCGLHPDFARVNKWNHGFAFVELDVKTGNYYLENLKVINGKVY